MPRLKIPGNGVTVRPRYASMLPIVCGCLANICCTRMSQTYTHFNPGEPNSGTSENCVNMYFDDGTWADVPCSPNPYTSGFICMINIGAGH